MRHLTLLAVPALLLATGATLPTSPTLPHATSMVAAWTLDEGAGAVVHDVTRGGLTGVVRDGVWTQGVSGTAIEFDGSGGHVELLDGAPQELTTLEEGTISLWFRFDGVPGIDTIHPLFYVGDGVGGPGNSELIIEIGHFDYETTIFFTIVVDDEVIPQCFNSIQQLVPGELYHFAAVVDQLDGLGPNRGTNTGYLNGRELVDRHYRFGHKYMAHFFDDVADPRETWFGRGILSKVSTPQMLDGLVDEIIVWDRPLTGPEVRDYYQGSKTRMEAALAR